MKEEVEDKCSGLILALDKFDPTYQARKYFLQSKKEINLDSIESMSAHKKETGKKSFLRLSKRFRMF